MKVQRIKFNGLDFILPEGREGGVIVTEIAYKKGERSYAHLMRDGRIMQDHIQIGYIDDIEFGTFIDIEVNTGAFCKGLFGNTW